MAKTASKVVVLWLRITPNTPFFLQFEAIFALFLCQKPCFQNPFCCPFSFSFSFFDSFFFALLGVLGLLVVLVLVSCFLVSSSLLLLFLFFSPLSFFHLLSLVIVLCQSLLGCFSSFRFQVCIFWLFFICCCCGFILLFFCLISSC